MNHLQRRLKIPHFNPLLFCVLRMILSTKDNFRTQDWLIFATEVRCVLCKAQTEILYLNHKDSADSRRLSPSRYFLNRAVCRNKVALERIITQFFGFSYLNNTLVRRTRRRNPGTFTWTLFHVARSIRHKSISIWFCFFSASFFVCGGGGGVRKNPTRA